MIMMLWKLQSFALRPLLVATCVLAVKITNDEVTTNTERLSRLGLDFTALTPTHLLELERQVLVLLGHRMPSGQIYQRYADALFGAANMRTGKGLAAPDMLEALGP